MSNADLTQITVPPHSLEAEQAVIGSVLLNPDSWSHLEVLLRPEDFYRREHRLLYAAISELLGKGQACDAITLSDVLGAQGRLEDAGGLAYIGELIANTPSAAHARTYGEIVRERSVRRRLARAANEIAESAFHPDGRNSDELLDQAEKKIFQIAESQMQEGGPQYIRDLLKKTVSRINELIRNQSSLTGLSTGFRDLDEQTAGLQRGELIIVAARPSMGKTTFAMNLVENAMLESGLPILVFSMEMPAEQLIMRMLASLGHIDQTRLRTGNNLSEEDWARLSSAFNLVQDKPLYIDDSAALTPIEVRTRARHLAKELGRPLGMIMIDYLQLMRVPEATNNRVNEISEISRSLKALAKEMNCPVMALSQLSRAVESRPNKRPVMSDLRESGAIEQDADLIMCIYRDEVYNKEDSKEKGIAEIIIVKQRNGPIGTTRLSFEGQFSRFNNLSQDYQPYDEE